MEGRAFAQKAVPIVNSFFREEGREVHGNIRLPNSIQENTVPQGFLESLGRLGGLGAYFRL